MTEKSSVGCTPNELPLPDAVVRVTSDGVQQGSGSVSSVATVATSSEALPIRPLIPFGQGWLSGSGE